MISMSIPGGMTCALRLNTSLTILLYRLRATASPSLLETRTAIRPSDPFPGDEMIVNSVFFHTVPSWYMRVISLRELILAFWGNFRVPCGAGLVSFIRNGEFFAAFGAPALQNFSAVFRSHALPESVSVGPFSFGWLECPFHWNPFDSNGL